MAASVCLRSLFVSSMDSESRSPFFKMSKTPNGVDAKQETCHIIPSKPIVGQSLLGDRHQSIRPAIETPAPLTRICVLV